MSEGILHGDFLNGRAGPSRPAKRARRQACEVSHCVHASPETASVSRHTYNTTAWVHNPQCTSISHDGCSCTGNSSCVCHTPYTRYPYCGDYAGFGWNAQALLAQKAHRQVRKRYRAQQLIQKHDFGMFSETHGLDGREEAYWLPNGVRAFWSHGTAHQGGVCLWVKDIFFNKFRETKWDVLEPGRIAVLRLRGGEGELDIFAAYLSTDSSEARQNSIKVLHRATRSKENVLSVVVGDFNFVEFPEDRWNLSAGAFSGENNSNNKDAKLFERLMRGESGYVEWEQPHYTCEAGGARSRIDRMYNNQHISYQFDRHCTCNVLEWDKDLSTHRAISFARRTPSTNDSSNKPINPAVFKQKGWADHVIRDFKDRCVHDSVGPSPLRLLVLLKDSIRECSGSGSFSQEEKDQDNEDELGATLACLKALERGSHKRIAQLRQRSREIRDLVPPEYGPDNVAAIVGALRERAVNLSRRIISEDVQELIQNPPEDPHDKDVAKNTVLKKLKKLSPGSSGTINAMRGAGGQITTSPEDIAKLLRVHWGEVFSRKDVDTAALDIWMRELFLQDENGLHITGLPTQESGRWIIKKGAVARAIRSARNTMPGPDGIPSLAYKALGGVAVDIFHGAAQALCTDSNIDMMRDAYSDRCAEGTHCFNLSLLCCLPKKVSGVDPGCGEFYDAESTRPLALVNTDNRIIAAAARAAWEPLLNSFISHHQQGFLKGRQMLNNVIDIDYYAMTVSLTSAKGAAIFFDFKAAFPSVSHKFLFESLAHIGMPRSSLAFIRALYDNNKCNVSYKGLLYEGFSMESGVRQGCPISPLLFAAAVDVLLRKLQNDIPDSVNKAFADDVALVIKRWKEDGGVARVIFDEFRKMSGLELNMPKTIVVPLWPKGAYDITNSVRDNPSDPWQNIGIQEYSTYLGFCSGPGKGSRSWVTPLKKFENRIKHWGKQGLGSFFGTVAYNTFAHSALMFVGQLESPPSNVLEREEKCIKHILNVPGGTFEATDAFFLKELYGQSKSFCSVEMASQAAKLRTLYTLDKMRAHHPDLQIRRIGDMFTRLKTCLEKTAYLDRIVIWHEWYNNSFAGTLIKNELDLSVQGIRVETILAKIAGQVPPPWDEGMKRRQKIFFQKTATQEIKKFVQPDPVNRIRGKLTRWFDPDAGRPSDIISHRMLIPGPPAWMARRAHHNLLRLQPLVPPRVGAAVIRCMWNSWCTARRYQQSHTEWDVCHLGCKGSHDSIEHYCRCSSTRDVLKNMFKIHLQPQRALAFFTLCTSEQEDDAVLALSALHIYAVYNCTNTYRIVGTACADRAKQCLRQLVLQGCAGHEGLIRLVDSRWRARHVVI